MGKPTHIGSKTFSPFVSIVVLLDESRSINEGGSWDKYWAKKNCRAELRTLKAEYKQSKKNIKNKWGLGKK